MTPVYETKQKIYHYKINHFNTVKRNRLRLKNQCYDERVENPWIYSCRSSNRTEDSTMQINN